MKPIFRFAATLLALFLGVCCTEEPDVIEVTSVTINTKAADMFVGETLQLEATVEPDNATDKEVTWSSNDETVASISPEGLVTALKEGNAIITALAGKCVSVCTISVTKKIVEVTSIELNRTTATLAIKETLQLIATVKPDDATDKTVEWSSSNNKIATVDNTGTVLSIKEGSATITAKAGNKSAKCEVTVVPNKVEVTSIELDKTAISLKEGEKMKLVATVKPDNATDKTVEWYSSDDKVAAVNNEGLVTAVSEGSATITAKAGEKTAKCEVTVISGKVEVASIELNKTSVTLEEGETFTLVPTIKPDNATDKTVTWSSSDESVATVDKAGKVKAVKEGTATITAKAGNQTAKCEVTVVAKKVEVTSVELDHTSISLREGETVKLVATVKPDNATDKTVTWSSSNENIATVDKDGNVTAILQGDVIIFAKAGKAEASCAVTVISANFKPNGEYLSFSGLAINSSIWIEGTNPTEITLEYSYDTITWYNWGYSGWYKIYDTIQLATGTKLYVRGKDVSENAAPRFVFGDKVAAGGNLMSLFFYDDFENKSSFDKKYKALRTLFRENQNLVEAPDLPATTLFEPFNDYDSGCYEGMFLGCVNLTKAPELPATTLASGCYAHMFHDCSSLTNAPELPATTLAYRCYEGMFSYCTNLTQTPELPATTLANECYKEMFSGCIYLTQAPELPATTLAYSCYQWMFSDCSSLTQAPELPATTLANSCYSGMFYGCTSLTKAPELPATTLANSCYYNMFEACSSLTTAPELLPATTLAQGCYSWMFRDCTNLTNAPELPATTLAQGCYSGMFLRCSSLTQAPELPATTLAEECYAHMFSGCSGLTKAPELPATTIAEECYASMFSGCSSLTKAPTILPATTLPPRAYAGQGCYSYMFYECYSLTRAPELPATTLAESCYSYMFGHCKSLTKAPEILPATTLADCCYYEMFSDCFSLTQAPELPATTLANSCYSSMFYGCTSLTKAPELPATTLANSCYMEMFAGCPLTKAPKLPATTLAESCYSSMFSGCGSLTIAPELPATTLAESCYSSMFSGCSSLTQAPELPAITLVNNCYAQMFAGAKELQYIKMMAINVPNYDCFGGWNYGWLNGCSESGTFVKNAAANWDESRVIPSGWTVQTATE